MAATVNTTTTTTTQAPPEAVAPKESAPPVVDAGGAQQPALMSSSSMSPSPSQASDTPSMMPKTSTPGVNPLPQGGIQGVSASEIPAMMGESSTSLKPTPQSGAQSNQSSETPKVMMDTSTKGAMDTVAGVAQGGKGSNTSTTMAQSTAQGATPTPQAGIKDGQDSITPAIMAQTSTLTPSPLPSAGAQSTNASSAVIIGGKETPQIGVQASATPTRLAQTSTMGLGVTPQSGIKSTMVSEASSTMIGTPKETPKMGAEGSDTGIQIGLSSTMMPGSTPQAAVKDTQGPETSPVMGAKETPKTGVQGSQTPTMMAQSSIMSSKAMGGSTTPSGVVIVQSSKSGIPATNPQTDPPTPGGIGSGTGSGTHSTPLSNSTVANGQTRRAAVGTGFTRPNTDAKTNSTDSRTTTGMKIDGKIPDKIPSTSGPVLFRTTRFSRAAPVSPYVVTTMKAGVAGQASTSGLAPSFPASTDIPIHVINGSTPGHTPKISVYPPVSPKATIGFTKDMSTPIPRTSTLGHSPGRVITQADLPSVPAPITSPSPIRTTTRRVEPTSRRVVSTTVSVLVTSTVKVYRSTTQVPRIKSTIRMEIPTSSAAPEMPRDVTYRIRYDGDCKIVLSNNDVRDKFEKEVKKMFMDKVGVPQDNVLLHDISCGSVDVLVTLHDVQQTQVERRLDEITSNPVPLVVTSAGQTHAFLPVSYTPSQLSTTTVPPAAPPQPTKSKGLREVDMIIIIIVCIVGGMLMIIIIALIVHECRRRSHSKTFDLRGTPRAHITTEDFTLTKMERGPAEYNDNGLIMNHNQQNGHSRTPLVGVATIVETSNQNGGTNCNGHHKSGKEGYEPETDVGPDSPSMSLMKSMRTPHTEGIENPSFSSEDILDSGTETDRENVSSDKGIDSPDHAPFQMEAVAETDSGRQSDSPIELPQDIDSTPQHSPRSIQSDNTPFDNTYEPFELAPIPELPTVHAPNVEPPKSPSSEEVMMPREEMMYPSGDTEEDRGSPPIVDVPSYSVQNNTYEMVETKPAGNRESDFFAPTEGATAF